MKKIKIITVLFVLILFTLKSQPGPYVQTTYAHSSTSELSSGRPTINTVPGFLMAGFRLSSTSGQFNFCVDKTDIDGNFNLSTDFSQEFNLVVAGDPDCSGSVSQTVTTCYGVSAVEVSGNPSSGTAYAIVGSTDKGLFYVGLNAVGQQTTAMFYPFFTSGATQISKPLITIFNTGTSSLNHFYITGSYATTAGVEIMYILKIDDTGAQLATTAYNLGAGARFRPTAILQSPYTTASAPELSIVGWCNTSGNDDGFFIRFDNNSASISQFLTYQGGLSTNEQIFSFNIASSTTLGGPGYIIGGFTDMSPPSTSWMMSINTVGAIDWSNVIIPSTYNPGGAVVGVTERFNTILQYEYYGVCTTPNGMTTLKIDDTGNPVGGTQNEFVYATAPGAIADNVTQINATAGPNYGIHVYGTTATSDHYLALGCFNGFTGCPTETITALVGPAPGPSATNTPTPGTNTGLLACTQITVSQTTNSNPANQLCPPTSIGLPPGGNNARSAVTSVKEEVISSPGFCIFPNPAKNTLSIRLTGIAQGSMILELENSLGQHIATFELSAKQFVKETSEIDLSSLNLKDGFYQLRLTANGKNISQKLVIAKE